VLRIACCAYPLSILIDSNKGIEMLNFLALQSISLDLRVKLANKASEIANHEVLMMVCKMQGESQDYLKETLGNQHSALLQEQDDLVAQMAKEYLS
jgi:hypothetical protein